ncbi:MAG: TadE/TadG family type IV pilus assembly protein [Pseudomonadota bacterium]
MSTMLRKLLRSKDGVSSIEFAILSPMFFALLTAVFEISNFVYQNASVQRAIEDVIYDIRTKQIYNIFAQDEYSDYSVEDFLKAEICKGVSVPNCKQNTEVSVQTFDVDYDSYSDSNNGDELSLGSPEILMRVEAAVTFPNILFTEAIFGKEDLTITAGLTFMTEP